MRLSICKNVLTISKYVLAGVVSCLLYLPPAPVDASEPKQPNAWTTMVWDKAVGRITGNEGASYGPMSFAINPGSGVWVLDQVNDRVLGFNTEGKLQTTITLPNNSFFDDIQQIRPDALVLLDRIKTERLIAIDTNGTKLSEVPLKGSGIDHGGAVTALLTRPDGIWAEVDSRISVRLFNRNLLPCQRQIVRGRPVSNARSLHAALDDQGGIVVTLSSRQERKPYRAISVAAKYPIERIVDYDMDAKGQVHVVVYEALRKSEPSFGVLRQHFTWIQFDENLNEMRRESIPVWVSEYEQQVEMRVGADGQLWQMGFTPQDVRIFHWKQEVAQ